MGVTSPLDLQRDVELLDRYLAGECSPEERVGAQEALTARAPLRAVYEAIQASVATDTALFARDDDAAWSRLSGAIDRPTARVNRVAVPEHRPTQRHSVGWRIRALQYGVGMALMATAIVVGSRMTTSRASTPVSFASFTAARSFVATHGEQTAVTLADGSRVVLAPDSRLEIAQGFGATNRMVVLRGEGYFEVTSGVAPFIVRAGEVTARVLGTAFNIRRYPTDAATRIAVVRGKISATNRRGATTLTARMVAVGNDSTLSTSTVDDPTQFTQWTTGRLVFRNAPASEVLAAVGRWYGLTFHAADTTLATQVLTTVIETRRSRTEALAVLASILDVRMTAMGDTITLIPKRATSARTPLRRRAADSPSLPELGR